MPLFEVRMNCEYCMWIEAEDKEDARKKAEKADITSEWDQAWSEITVEEAGEDPDILYERELEKLLEEEE